MTRFFFHLHECGRAIPDTEGKPMIDLASALQSAIRIAWGVMAAEVARGKLCLSCHIEVENGETGERTRVAFRDALKVSGI